MTLKSKNIVLFICSGLLAVLSFFLLEQNVQLQEVAREQRKIMHRQRVIIDHQTRQIKRLKRRVDSDALWVTRALLSESNDPSEWRYIAWVIRNRRDRHFRGAASYKDVVLHPYQFSAFNRTSLKRQFYMSMTGENTPYPNKWKLAEKIAREVILAPREESPFPSTVVYFYSPISMEGGGAPYWAYAYEEFPVDSVNSHRFRFFEL